MRKRLWYPKIMDIKENNQRVLGIYQASKADRHKMTGSYNLPPVLKEVKSNKGDVYEKASILLRGINKAHAFSSANKRTAYFTANEFIARNEGFLIAKKRDNQREISVKVREGRIADKEIANWLKYADKNKVYGVDR